MHVRLVFSLSAEKVCTSLELFVINCSKKYVKEIQ
jgi:hypothetical protein